MSATTRTITISTNAFVEIEMAIRLEIAHLERITAAGVTGISVRRLADLRAAMVEFSA